MLSFIMRFERDPDRDRFAALYQMNHTRMERLARQLLGDQNRAEDAVHDTFMKLIRHYDELRDRSNERLASWLLVVVKTTALDMLRRDKWENACEELPEGQPVCCDVLLEDETGERRVIAYPDAALTRLGIDEGDTVRLNHHTLIKL